MSHYEVGMHCHRLVHRIASPLRVVFERGCVGVVCITLLALVGHARPLQGECFYGPGTSSDEISTFLGKWAARHGLGSIRAWNLDIQQTTANLLAQTDMRAIHVSLSLDSASCVSSASGEGLSTAALDDLAAGLPLSLVVVSAKAPEEPSGRVYDFDGLLAVVLVFLLIVVRRQGSDARPGALEGAALVALAVLAAWPVVVSELTEESQIMRVAFAARDVFGDWNHPFLFYLLTRPATWFSLEPWVVRIPGFIFVVAQAGVIGWAAWLQGGRAAGVLASTLMLCDVRVRHGLFDVSDWDLAGFLLSSILLWVIYRERSFQPTARSWALLAALAAAGMASSYLMAVPVGVLVAMLWLDRRFCSSDMRQDRIGRIVVTVVFVAMAYLVIRTFITGMSGRSRLDTLLEVLVDMRSGSLLGRTWWVILPLAAGLVWLATGLHTLSRTFAALVIAVTPMSVLVAWHWSATTGGHHVGLVAPIAAFAAGCGTSVAMSRMVSWIIERFGTLAGLLAKVVLSGLLISAVVTLPRNLPIGIRPIGALRTFDEVNLAEGYPVFSNIPSHLRYLLAYDRARRGAGDISDALPDLRTLGIRRLDPATCEPEGGWKSAPGYFHYVEVDYFGAPNAESCGNRLRNLCEPWLVQTGTLLRFYRCKTALRDPPE